MERQLICTAGRWNTSLRGQTERVGVVQPGEEKARRRAGGGLSVSKWGYKKKEQDRLFSRVCCDRTRKIHFKPEE